jgi:hypothetical protein
MVGGSKVLLMSVVLIVLTFAALEWRQAHELQHARAHRRRREWSGKAVRESRDSSLPRLAAPNGRGR